MKMFFFYKQTFFALLLFLVQLIISWESTGDLGNVLRYCIGFVFGVYACVMFIHEDSQCHTKTNVGKEVGTIISEGEYLKFLGEDFKNEDHMQ